MEKYYLYLYYGIVVDVVEVSEKQFFSSIDYASILYEISKDDFAIDGRRTYSYYDPDRDLFVSIGYIC